MIKVVLVDDHKLFRDGVSLILSEEENISLMGSFSNGPDLLQFIAGNKPDIMLTDIAMPGMDGATTTMKALEHYPDLKIIVLSMFDDEEHYNQMIELGVKGFILKKSGSFELVQAIHEVYKGGNYFSQELLQKIILLFNKRNEAKLELSEREEEVLVLICNGYTNNEIGEKLCISPKTADNHRCALLGKTKTKNSAHLVMYAMKNKLVSI